MLLQIALKWCSIFKKHLGKTMNKIIIYIL